MLLVGQKVDYFLYCQKSVFFTLRGNFLVWNFSVKSKIYLWTISGNFAFGPIKIWTLLVGQKVDYFLYCQKRVFFYFKGSFLTFVFEFGIFWSKAKLIFGQFQAILLLGPSKSGRSLWVKKWISTEVLKNVFFHFKGSFFTSFLSFEFFGQKQN